MEEEPLRNLRNLRKLTPELEEKARKELREDPVARHKAIEDLKAAFAEKCPHLKLEREDDLFIIRFLRSRKFDPANSLELLRNYHQYQLDHPQYAKYFLAPSYENAKVLTDLKLIGVLPHRAKNGSAVLYLKVGNLEPSKIKQEQLQNGMAYYTNKLLDDEASQIAGITFLEDLNGFSLMNVMKMDQGNSETNQQDQYYFLQHCMPMRFKGIHAVHQPFYISVFMAIVKPFMKQKLRERIFFHGSDTNELSHSFNLDHVPVEVGGKLEYDFFSTFHTLEHLYEM